MDALLQIREAAGLERISALDAPPVINEALVKALAEADELLECR